ncbi:MAG: autotransporter-associated beta strand repeat-containing protein, partial [Planctomycetales bacterium]|nr:autotransporter-associated beta strand repeat-containing protein [Planctomycetales bacterium]
MTAISNGLRRGVALAVLACAWGASSAKQADAALSYTIGGSWPDAARRDAADNAMRAIVDRYNAYGDFGNQDIYVYYNAGIPTAQASYLGSIGFGGTWPAERVAQHELAHYLGLPSGAWGSLFAGGSWGGEQAAQLVRQFEGDQATLNGDSVHFWPYGLNYDNEGSELNKQRQVAMVYAMRADLGIGTTRHPSTARIASLTASDGVGESSFNISDHWSDGYFAHPGAAYATGGYVLRTPQSPLSFSFAGNSLILSDSRPDTGLYFKGEGSSGVITIDNLLLNGGWIDHRGSNALQDVFRLDGAIHVQADSHLRASNGDVNLVAAIDGAAALTIHTTPSPTQDARYVRFLSAANSFSGNLINQSRFELATGAKFKFKIEPGGVSNAISGRGALATRLNGVVELDTSAIDQDAASTWNLVTAANVSYGNSFTIPGYANFQGVWSNGDFQFDQATGALGAVTTWNVDEDGLWSDAANWTRGVPTTHGAARLGETSGNGAGGTRVEIDSPVSLNYLTFDSSQTYSLDGSSPLSLVGDGDVVARSGGHRIGVEIAGTAGLQLSGPGSVTLAAANSYAGLTRIKSGTLRLEGEASIANSSRVQVEHGATLDVAAVTDGFRTAVGQTLAAAGGRVVGDVVVGNASVVEGTGSFSARVRVADGGRLQVGGTRLPEATALRIIDNFQTYNVATGNTVGANPGGDVTGGAWDGVFDGTSNARIA